MGKIVLEGGSFKLKQYSVIDSNIFMINPALCKMKPYDATGKLCEAIQLLKSNPELNKKNIDIPEQIDAATTTILRIFMPAKMRNWFRIVEIDDDLKRIIENTGNDIFHRKCFIDNIFINCDFAYDNYIFRGILVLDASANNSIKGIVTDGGESSRNNLAIASLIYNTHKKEYCILITDLFSPADKNAQYIRTIVCNILDLVTNNIQDIQIVDTANFSRNNKTNNRNKTKHDKIFVRSARDFKKYAENFSKHEKCNHRFIVRGHFRHYRDDRYSDELRKSPKWIKPFYKGDGIIIEKKYNIKK